MDKIYFAFTPHVEPPDLEYIKAIGYPKSYAKTSARATIAMKKVGSEIHYGVAVCSEGDNFNKSTGRSIATDRMQKGYGKFPITKEMSTRFKDDRDLMLFYLNSMTEAVADKIKTIQRKIGEGRKKNSGEIHGSVVFTKG